MAREYTYRCHDFQSPIDQYVVVPRLGFYEKSSGSPADLALSALEVGIDSVSP